MARLAVRSPAPTGQRAWRTIQTPRRTRACKNSAQRGGTNKRKPRLGEILQEAAEEDAQEIRRVFREAINATKMVFPGEGALPVEVPDHEMRRKSVDSWLDRALGKPKQQTELSFDPAQFLEMIAPSSPAASIDPASHLRLAPSPIPQPFVIDVEPEPEDDKGDEDAA